MNCLKESNEVRYMSCPLCGSQSIVKVEDIQTMQLEKIYLRLTGTSFSYLLNQDISQLRCERCGLIYFHPMITGDETFYASLQKISWYYLSDKEEYQYARQFITSTDKVLDVGSGKGAFAKLLSTSSYVGLDLSVGAKELAKKNGVLILNEIIQEHACKHPEEYDVVCSFQVLEHVPNPFEIIEAQLKALKRNGLLVITVPSENSFLRYTVNEVLNMPPHHVTRWCDKSLEHIAMLFNLDLLDIHHEKVQEIHKVQYLSTLIQNFLLPFKLLDESLIRKVVSNCAGLVARVLKQGLKDELLPYGHTVICVYRKR